MKKKIIIKDAEDANQNWGIHCQRDTHLADGTGHLL